MAPPGPFTSSARRGQCLDRNELVTPSLQRRDIQRRFQQLDLPARFKAIIVELLDRADWTTHESRPSQKRLAIVAGCAVRTVRNHLRAAERLRLFKVDRGNSRRASVYTLWLDHPLFKGDKKWVELAAKGIKAETWGGITRIRSVGADTLRIQSELNAERTLPLNTERVRSVRSAQRSLRTCEAAAEHAPFTLGRSEEDCSAAVPLAGAAASRLAPLVNQDPLGAGIPDLLTEVLAELEEFVVNLDEDNANEA